MTTNETKQNPAYPGLYELGLRADMLEVELKAACAACTHLHEKLEATEADWRASAERYDREVVQLRSELLLAAADRDAFGEKLKEAEAECVRANDSARARDERAARRIDELETQLAETRERLEAHRQNLAAANEWGARAEAKLQAVEALLKKPEWARECLAVLSREGRAR